VLARDGIEFTAVGKLPSVREGEYLVVWGDFVENKSYGMQFQIKEYEIKLPEDAQAVEKYLGSGAIKGVGPKRAARIVQYFGEDTMRILDEEPERLAEIPGITEAMARDIAVQVSESREMREGMVFLQQYGLKAALALRIYQKYGSRLYGIIRENPYRIAEDMKGVGFRIADEIASRAGISADSDFRIRSGLCYVLQQASAGGHTYYPKSVLYEEAEQLLGISRQHFDKHLMDLVLERKLFVKQAPEEEQVYSSQYYYLELGIAHRILDLNLTYEVEEEALEERIRQLEEKKQIQLDAMQKRAVQTVATHGVTILTGGPGTGKTTTIRAILEFFEAEGMDVVLAAPTGRAAKRMTEATGYEAKTIHRLLELKRELEEEEPARFERNEEHPLEVDGIIIDEMSMVDVHLMSALLRAVLPGSRLVLVGDENQLPSVGPGSILKDLIAAEQFPVIKLTKIFRQASHSDIVVNAHKINGGEMIPLQKKSQDFLFLERESWADVVGLMVYMIRDKLPAYVQARMEDIQVLTPMRKGNFGVEGLNPVLQEHLNPPSPSKTEREFPQGIFREGDKVMQIKNNYQLEWNIRSPYGYVQESGVGVFNGDTGVIVEIDLRGGELTVEFEEKKQVTYGFRECEELELAYAITIHKAQGSEYPAVIMPLVSGSRLLFNRNLLYTGVTRGKNCVMIIGRGETVYGMIQNCSQQRRYSGLEEKIRECADFAEERLFGMERRSDEETLS
jgi:exodeoxyribonuclease V alpha subunit